MTSYKPALAAAVSALALVVSAAPAAAQTTAVSATTSDNQQIVVTGRPRIGEFGVDLTAIDPSAKPGDDFERYASGAWIDRTPIPSDRAFIGSFYDLGETSQEQVRDLVAAPSAAQTKYGIHYAAFMDEAAVERAGIAPLMKDIARVRAIGDKAEFARFMGDAVYAFGASLFSADPYADTSNPEITSLWLGQSGLGLPERDYYFADQFAKQRAAYQAYVARTLKTLGVANPSEAAQKVLAFETYVAQLSWKADDRRDISKINNPMSSAELASYAPGVDWGAYFAGLKLPPQDRLIVSENTAVRDIAALYASTDLETLKLWQQFHVASEASPYLNKAMVDSRFGYTSSISGVTEQRPRWKRAVTQVNTALGELVGQAYVAEYFPPIAKQRMDELVANLKLAMADRIKANDWMSGPTKEAALEKLARMDVMVGHPETFRNYDGVRITPASLYENVVNAARFNGEYTMGDVGKPVDRKKWAMNPQEVNAYNGGLENKMVFPAGILQPPFFDPYADPAVNYGAIGAVIGHEISHGFDDQGRKIDAAGAVRDWWTQQDSARFEAEAKKFGAQYAKYEAVPGAFLDPELTMGENIADLAGVQVAYDAYKRSLGGKEAPVIGGLTGDQRFFLAYAQVWRSKVREDAIRSQVTADPHSPERFRVIGPLRNIDAWYEAFNVGPDSKMYIAPEDRVRIW